VTHNGANFILLNADNGKPNAFPTLCCTQ